MDISAVGNPATVIFSPVWESKVEDDELKVYPTSD